MPYDLPGPQVEPKAACWGDYVPPLHVLTNAEVLAALPVGEPKPYPTGAVADDELEELRELAQMRDDPTALASTVPDRFRRRLSPLLQLRPPALGAVYNTLRDDSQPVIKTGRELARMFEAETPGLAHRQAMNLLIQDKGWSPPRQARAWAALDIAIYSALLVAWHIKWNTREKTDPTKVDLTISYRPRPWEEYHKLDVLFDYAVNAAGTGDGEKRIMPEPTPGTPRHPAYPSGHSTYSAAASEVMKFLFPGNDEALDDLADNIGMARLWAGIHWRSDHTLGQIVGKTVGQLVIAQLTADTAGLPATPPPSTTPPPGPPPPGTVC